MGSDRSEVVGVNVVGLVKPIPEGSSLNEAADISLSIDEINKVHGGLVVLNVSVPPGTSVALHNDGEKVVINVANDGKNSPILKIKNPITGEPVWSGCEVPA